MKRILMITLLILLIPLIAIPADRIVEVGENNVEWTPSKTMTDITNKTVEVWDTDNTQSYGQVGINKELTSAQGSLTESQNLDCPVYKQEQIDKRQVIVDRLNAIKAKVIESNE